MDAMERLLLPDGPDSTGYALTAGFVAEEGRDAKENRHQLDRVVEDHDDAVAECRLGRTGALEAERHVDLGRRHEDTGGPTQENTLQRPPAGHTAGERQHLPQGRPERHLVDTRPGDTSGQAEEPGS